MVDSVRIEVKGLRQLGEAFAGMSDKMQKKRAGQATGAGARLVKNAVKTNMKRNPTVDTGLMERNVIIKKLGKAQAGGLTSAHIVTEKKVTYPTDNKGGKRNTRRSATYSEFGTVNMPAEPSFGPGLRNNIGPATNAIRDKLASGIAEDARSLAK